MTGQESPQQLIVTNPFWSAVCGETRATGPRSAPAASLHAAAVRAFSTPGEPYGLRHPRELIDLDGRFRHFIFEERRFIGKKTTAAAGVQEARNSRRAQGRLAQPGVVEPLVPLLAVGTDLSDRILISEDRGPTLAHNPTLVAERLPWERFLGVLDGLLDAGIEWPGFLPRNVIVAPTERPVLLDWESCRFRADGSRCTAVGDLTLLFWSIGWAEHFGFEAEAFGDTLRRVLDLSVRTDRMDDFELAYASMAGGRLEQAEVRRRCGEATILTESTRVSDQPLASLSPDVELPLSAAQVGHVLHELLPIHLSVLYTFASTAYIQQWGDDRYTAFVGLVNQVLILVTPPTGLEGDPLRRRRLQFLVFAVVVAVLLEGADPRSLAAASSEGDLLRQVCECSEITSALVRDRNELSSMEGWISKPALRRLSSSVEAACGVNTPDAGLPWSAGLRALAGEVVELVSRAVAT